MGIVLNRSKKERDAYMQPENLTSLGSAITSEQGRAIYEGIALSKLQDLDAEEFLKAGGPVAQGVASGVAKPITVTVTMIEVNGEAQEFYDADVIKATLENGGKMLGQKMSKVTL